MAQEIDRIMGQEHGGSPNGSLTDNGASGAAEDSSDSDSEDDEPLAVRRVTS
jgi:hypothetical protein